MVDWCVREILTFRGSPVPLHSFAGALIEVATALGSVGRFEEAERYRAEALAIARARGFHEVAYRAESLNVEATRAVASGPVARTTRNILESVRRLEPESLPAHVRVSYAGV
jgi:hypothetical protein